LHAHALRAGLAAALVTGLAGSASAEGPASPEGARKDEDLRAEARTIARQGDAQFEAGRCDKALPLWRRADQTYHAPTLLLRVARCQGLLGRVVEAAATLQAIVDEPIRAGAPEAFVFAREEARRELPAVRRRIAALRVAVGSEGADVPAAIEIDGAPVQTRGLEIPLDPGEHHVAVRAGAAVWERTVMLDDGEKRTLDVPLEADPAPAPRRTQRTIGLALGGLGVASIAAGVGLGVAALGISRRLDLACGADRARCPPSAQGDIARVGAFSTGADGALGGGAALAVAGAVLLVMETRPEAQEPRVRFTASPVHAALRVEF
jgi:hypothetical protein